MRAPRHRDVSGRIAREHILLRLRTTRAVSGSGGVSATAVGLRSAGAGRVRRSDRVLGIHRADERLREGHASPGLSGGQGTSGMVSARVTAPSWLPASPWKSIGSRERCRTPRSQERRRQVKPIPAASRRSRSASSRAAGQPAFQQHVDGVEAVDPADLLALVDAARVVAQSAPRRCGGRRAAAWRSAPARSRSRRSAAGCRRAPRGETPCSRSPCRSAATEQHVGEPREHPVGEPRPRARCASSA